MRYVVAALLALPFAPTASAEADCAAVTEQPPNATGIYVIVDVMHGSETWMENNGYPGLQRQPCIRGDTGTLIGPDAQVLDAMTVPATY